MVNTVVRGGSWNNKPENVRDAFRNRNAPGNNNNNVGFRCLRDGRRKHKFPGQRFTGYGQ